MSCRTASIMSDDFQEISALRKALQEAHDKIGVMTRIIASQHVTIERFGRVSSEACRMLSALDPEAPSLLLKEKS